MKSQIYSSDDYLKDPVAKRIWEEIIHSYNTYTHDSSIVRFFLPEQLVLHCRPTAAAFTSLPYSPTLEPKSVYETNLYYIFLLSTVCGVQIYLKEHAIKNNFASYDLHSENKQVQFAKDNAMYLLTQGISLPDAPSQVMKKFTAYLLTVKKPKHYAIKGKTFTEKRFEPLLPASILWGYFFTQQMIKITKNNTKYI